MRFARFALRAPVTSLHSTWHRMGSPRDLPHVDMRQPITKFAATVSSTGWIADMVSMAFRESLRRARESGKYAPIDVWIDPEVYAPGTINQSMYK